MRIGVDLRTLMEPRGSGVATYTKLMLQTLATTASGIQDEWIFYTSGRKRRGLPSSIPQGEQKHMARSNLLLNISTVFLNRPSVKSCYSSVDLVWQPNPLFVAKSDYPLYVTLHDLSFLHYPKAFPRHTRLWYLRWVKAWLKAAPKEAYLITVSKYTADDLLEYFPQWRNRVSVVPAPPPKLNMVANKAENINLASLGVKSPYVLSLGTIEPRKNIESLILGFCAFATRYPEYRLVLVGKFGHKRHQLNLLVPSALKDRILFTEYVSHRLKKELIKQAFALVYPSYYEGYGYPPLEAFAYGIPVIASFSGALPETLGNGAIWLDPYRTADELPYLLSSLVEDSELYQRYQLSGQARLKFLSDTFTVNPLLELWQRKK